MTMIVAVLQQRSKLRLASRDVFVSTVGGMRIAEPAGDLATALAVASACKDQAVPSDVVAIGELGLAGELRRVRDLPQRLAEASRLGFTSAIVPLEPGSEAGSLREVDGMQVVGVPDIGSALRVLDLGREEAVPLFRANAAPHRRPPLGLV
jgi:DNA repair protein RadA/Sms